MKGMYLFYLLVCVFGVSAYADVGRSDLEAIYELTESGQYQEALEKHLWFHEESKHSPGMGGVRLSYAISAWVELGKQYPPAIDALKNVRDKNKSILLSGDGNFKNFHDLSSINQGLGDDHATLELFLTLDQMYPDQTRMYYIVAEELLIKFKRYDVCERYIGDPIYKFEGARHDREYDLSLAKTNSDMNTPRFLQRADERYLERVAKLIEVLLAVNKKDEAKEVQKRAMAYFYNDDIEYAVP